MLGDMLLLLSGWSLALVLWSLWRLERALRKQTEADLELWMRNYHALSSELPHNVKRVVLG